MADQEKYETCVQLAQEYEKSGEFREAERELKKSLGFADPSEYQAIINRIRSVKEKAKAAPRPDVKAKAQEELRFGIYPVRFKDVIGYDRQKKFAKRIVELPLKRGGLFTKFRMAKSSGILLYGPPGTGKSLFAKAISGEFGIPMKDIFISDILGKLVGDSERNMRKAFEDAKALQPSMLFFDELDALGGSRESANDVTNNDIKNTVNEMLKQLSELHDNKEHSVFVIAATNLPWMIDNAIKRSGRIEHTIFMGPPGLLDRIRLFEYYLPSKGEGTTVNAFHLALATIRYSAADIEKVCSGAKRRAIEDGRGHITTRDILRVLKDKTEGTSSLDAWILEAKKTYIKSEKTRTEKSGFMGLKRNKIRTAEEGKLSKEEMKIYKPLIRYLKETMRWWHLANAVRFMARNTGI